MDLDIETVKDAPKRGDGLQLSVAEQLSVASMTSTALVALSTPAAVQTQAAPQRTAGPNALAASPTVVVRENSVVPPPRESSGIAVPAVAERQYGFEPVSRFAAHASVPRTGVPPAQAQQERFQGPREGLSARDSQGPTAAGQTPVDRQLSVAAQLSTTSLSPPALSDGNWNDSAQSNIPGAEKGKWVHKHSLMRQSIAENEIFAVIPCPFLEDVFATATFAQVNCYQVQLPATASGKVRMVRTHEFNCNSVPVATRQGEKMTSDFFYALCWLVLGESLVVCAGGQFGQIVALDYGQRKSLWTSVGHTGPIEHLAMHPSIFHFFASASDDTSVRVWDGRTGECLAVCGGFVGPRERTICVDWFSDEVLIAGSGDHSVNMWNVAECLQNDARSYPVDGPPPRGPSPYGDKDGSDMFEASWVRGGTRWSLHVQVPIWSDHVLHTNMCDCIAHVGDGWIVSRSAGGQLFMWRPMLDVDSSFNVIEDHHSPYEFGRLLEIRRRMELWFLKFAISRDKELVAIGSNASVVSIASLRSGRHHSLLKLVSPTSPRLGSDVPPVVRHVCWIEPVCGRVLLVLGMDHGALHLYEFS